METTISIPGRVVLGGDIAPILGGPELVAAVDTRLRVTVEERDSDGIEIESPFVNSTIPVEELTETGGEQQSLTVTKGNREVPAFTLLRRSIQLFDGTPPNRMRIRIDLDEGFEMGTGLGSSTALAVGLVAAFGRVTEAAVTREEVARLVTDLESELYGSARAADAHAIASGGVVLADGDIEQAAYETDIVIGRSKTKPDRDVIRRRIRHQRRTLDDLYDQTQELMDMATRELWNALQTDEERARALLTYLGGLVETLGGASNPVAQARASILTQFDGIGCKQSDFGGRATLLTVPPEGSLESVVLTYRQTGSDPLVTAVAQNGIEYED